MRITENHVSVSGNGNRITSEASPGNVQNVVSIGDVSHIHQETHGGTAPRGPQGSGTNIQSVVSNGNVEAIQNTGVINTGIMKDIQNGGGNRIQSVVQVNGRRVEFLREDPERTGSGEPGRNVRNLASSNPGTPLSDSLARKMRDPQRQRVTPTESPAAQGFSIQQIIDGTHKRLTLTGPNGVSVLVSGMKPDSVFRRPVAPNKRKANVLPMFSPIDPLQGRASLDYKFNFGAKKWRDLFTPEVPRQRKPAGFHGTSASPRYPTRS